jgi:hypothetical protein
MSQGDNGCRTYWIATAGTTKYDESPASVASLF